MRAWCQVLEGDDAMRRVDPYRLPHLRTLAVRAVGVALSMLLAGAAMISPATAYAQDAFPPASGSSPVRASVALLGQTMAGGLTDARVTAPSGELSGSNGSLFREASTLERGWQLVGGSPLLETGRGGEEPAVGTWLPGGSGSDDHADKAPPFLVELFDAREVMVWVRGAAEWGKEARRVLFGPRGIVRMGSVPDSDRPRIRLELTDTRPGARFVILTR
jgi:hypothetical protein